MSIAKFVEGYNKVLDERLIKAQEESDANPYPIEELKKVKDTAPESPIAKRYGGNGVIDDTTALISLAIAQDADLYKRLDKGEKKLDKIDKVRKLQRESDPKQLISNLYSNVFSYIAGTDVKMEDLLDLSADEFEKSYIGILEEKDAYDLDLPVKVDADLIQKAFKELYKNTVAPKKGLAGSPINESEATKTPEATASPISEGNADQPEAETSTTTSTVTTSTPEELPKDAPKAADAKTASVNVTVETPALPTPQVPNVTVETPAPQITNVSSTQQSVINEGEKKGEVGTPEKSTINSPKLMTLSELLQMSKETVNTETSSVESNNYLSLFDETGDSTNINSTNTTVAPVNSSSTINSPSGETIETTSQTNNIEATANNQKSVINNEAEFLESLYERKTSTNVQNSANSLQTEVSKKAPMLSKTEAPLSKPQEIGSPKSAEPMQAQQPTVSESSATPQMEATPQSQTGAEPSVSTSEEAQKAGGATSSGIDTSELENRLARIERVLSGPLDVRVIS